MEFTKKLTQRKIDSLYQEHRHLIVNKAIHIHRSMGYDVDELISYGNELFMKAVRKWDRKRPFENYLNGWLRRMVRLHRKTYHIICYGKIPVTQSNYKTNDIRNRINHLSPEAKKMCMWVLSRSEGCSYKEIKSEMLKHFRTVEGINRSTWTKVKEEVREIVLC